MVVSGAGVSNDQNGGFESPPLTPGSKKEFDDFNFTNTEVLMEKTLQDVSNDASQGPPEEAEDEAGEAVSELSCLSEEPEQPQQPDLESEEAEIGRAHV